MQAKKKEMYSVQYINNYDDVHLTSQRREEAITCMAENRIQAFLFGDVSRLVTPRNPLLAAHQ
jgi:nitrate reductase beta subunit